LIDEGGLSGKERRKNGGAKTDMMLRAIGMLFVLLVGIFGIRSSMQMEFCRKRAVHNQGIVQVGNFHFFAFLSFSLSFFCSLSFLFF
jgi:hypothetical protein